MTANPRAAWVSGVVPLLVTTYRKSTGVLTGADPTGAVSASFHTVSVVNRTNSRTSITGQQ